MKKNTIKFSESQLKKIVAESVKRVLKEHFDFIDLKEDNTMANTLNKVIEEKEKEDNNETPDGITEDLFLDEVQVSASSIRERPKQIILIDYNGAASGPAIEYDYLYY